MQTQIKSQNITSTSKRFVIVLLEEFAIYSFGSLLDALRIANALSGKALYNWIVLAENGAVIRSSACTEFKVDFGLIELQRDDTVLICGGLNVQQNTTKNLVSWIRRQARKGVSIGGVDTGSYAVARAGLLDGKSATIHWENQDSFREEFDEVDLTRSIFCIDGAVITSAGGCTSIDLILKLIENDHGSELAKSVSQQLMYQCHEDDDFAQRLSTSTRLGARNRKVIQAIRIMEENLEDPISSSILASKINISTRQLERLFRHYLDKSPQSYYKDLRLRKAKNLLQQTNMSVINVALSCGFESSSHFSKSYKLKYTVSPFDERREKR